MYVYVAGAYSADTIIQCLINIREGTRWSLKLLHRGHVPFVPWLDYPFTLLNDPGDPEVTVEMYYEYSLAWLQKCDCVFVTPHWEESKGTQREIEEAHRLGIPVLYSIDELDHYSPFPSESSGTYV